MDFLQLTETPINDIGHIFAASHWISLFSLLFFILITIVLTIVIKKFGKNKGSLVGFVFATFGAVFFVMMNSSFDSSLNSNNYSWKTETTSWMSVYSSLLIGLLSLVIPFYIFFIIIKIIIKSKNSDVKKRTYFYGIGGFISTKSIGIIVAFCMIPLIYLIGVSYSPPQESSESINFETIPDWIVSWTPYVIEWFTNIYLIIACIIGAIGSGFFLRIKNKKRNIENDQIVQAVFTIDNFLRNMVTKIFYLIPYFVATKFSVIFINGDGAFVEWGKLIIVYLVGFVTIMIISSIITIISMRGENRVKRYFKTTSTLWAKSFASRNSIVSIPVTINTAKELGSTEEISTFVATFGSLSALIMCSGFFPTLIVLFTAINFETITSTYLVMIFFTILMVSIGSFGLGSSDLVIVLTTMGVLGFNEATIEWATSLTTLLLVLLESLNIVGDVTSHISLTLLLERMHGKHKKEINSSNLIVNLNDVF